MAEKAKEVKLWGGRFEESVTDAVERFTESISYDKALYKHDIMGSRAHASMLAKQVLFLSLCALRFGLCASLLNIPKLKLIEVTENISTK